MSTTDTLINKPEQTKKASVFDTILLGSSIIVLLGAIALLLTFLLKPAPIVYLPGQAPLAAQDSPIQNRLHGSAADPMVFDSGGTSWTLTPRATYQISARVLGNKTYSDWQSPFVPRDLALAWGEMSDPAVDEWIKWRQSGRWYYYNWPGDSPYKGSTIRNQSANVHIIPATENLDRALQGLEKNDVIYMEGQLVDLSTTILGAERFTKTSLSRTDSGGGACEILYVEKLIFDGQVFE